METGARRDVRGHGGKKLLAIRKREREQRLKLDQLKHLQEKNSARSVNRIDVNVYVHFPQRLLAPLFTAGCTAIQMPVT